MSAHAMYRELAWTEKVYLCLVPGATVVGDSVILRKGGKVPLIVRPKVTSGYRWEKACAWGNDRRSV